MGCIPERRASDIATTSTPLFCSVNKVYWQHLIVEQQVSCIFIHTLLSGSIQGGECRSCLLTVTVPPPDPSLPLTSPPSFQAFERIDSFFFFGFNFICHLCRSDKGRIYSIKICIPSFYFLLLSMRIYFYNNNNLSENRFSLKCI